MEPSSPGTAGISTSTAATRVIDGLPCPVEFSSPDPGTSAEVAGPGACPVADPGAVIGAPGSVEAPGTAEVYGAWGCPELPEDSLPFVLFGESGSVGFIRLFTPLFLSADCAFLCRPGFLRIQPAWSNQRQVQFISFRESASPAHWPHARVHQTPAADPLQTPARGLQG